MKLFPGTRTRLFIIPFFLLSKIEFMILGNWILFFIYEVCSHRERGDKEEEEESILKEAMLEEKWIWKKKHRQEKTFETLIKIYKP